MYNFAPVTKQDSIVYGAQRPGYGSFDVDITEIQTWIQFMRQQGISRVCCLLDNEQLLFYPDNLIEIYRKAFGAENVINAPVPDYNLTPENLLQNIILPFLAQSKEIHQKVVVHCAGGVGRTGQVLAAWLVFSQNLSPQEAIEVVRSSPQARRNPLEVIEAGNATLEELVSLLEACKPPI